MVVFGLGTVFEAFGVMLTTILQVPFAKFLIPVPDTLQIFGVVTRIDHFEVETYVALLIFSNVVLLVTEPFFTAFSFFPVSLTLTVGAEWPNPDAVNVNHPLARVKDELADLALPSSPLTSIIDRAEAAVMPYKHSAISERRTRLYLPANGVTPSFS